MQWKIQHATKHFLKLLNSPTHDTNIRDLISALKWCSKTRDVTRGRKLHAEAITSGYVSNIFIANTLIDMYGKCGSILEAQSVFDNMYPRSIVSWNVLIMGYVENGQGENGLTIYRVTPLLDSRTLVAALKACTREEGALEEGKAIHAFAKECVLHNELYVACTLISMYARCGSVVDARRVFDRMVYHDLGTWNAMMSGYMENDDPHSCLEMFESIRDPDCISFTIGLKACSAVKSLQKVIELHTRAAEYGFHLEVYFASALVDAYARCGSLRDAERLFWEMPVRDVVSYTSLMGIYTELGHEDRALELLDLMRFEGCIPDVPVYVSALKACNGHVTRERETKLRTLETVMSIHTQVAKTDACYECFVSNTLISVYSKCGSMTGAREVFDRMRVHDAVSWTTLLLGYVENGCSVEFALPLLSSMWMVHSPDGPSYAAALKVCGSVPALGDAKSVHGEACRYNVDIDVTNALIDVYGKCGNVDFSQFVFDLLPSRDLVAWNSLMSTWGRHGRESSRHVFDALQSLQEEGLYPDNVTLVCVLTACSHAGLADVGKIYFEEQGRCIEHYICMVDALGRANRLEAAVGIVNAMPEETSVDAMQVALRSVLGACSKWNNVQIANVIYERLLKMGKADAAAYLLMEKIRVSAKAIL